VTAALLLMALAMPVRAADVQGILLDRACSPKIVESGDQKAAQAQTRTCGLMPDCVKAGYGVLTADGKFITFDAAGNLKAEAALKASTKKDDIRVSVTGSQSGDTMKVSAIHIL
jgi:hypothetical protein